MSKQEHYNEQDREYSRTSIGYLWVCQKQDMAATPVLSCVLM